MTPLRKTALAAAIVAAFLASTAACSCQASSTTPPVVEVVEVEDCDAEDYRNRETDCGFPAKTTKPPAKPTTKTPAPAKSRRR